MKKKSKAQTSTSAQARGTLHELTRGRNRRFEDTREKRGKQKRRQEMQSHFG